MIRDTLSKADHRKGTTRDREKAYRQVINTWLKIPENFDYAAQVIQQNKERKLKMNDPFGGTKENPKDVRATLSIPTGLYYTLQKFEQMHEGKFLKNKEDSRWFSRKFPEFSICDRI